MRFVQTGLAGAWLIEPEPIADARGLFARTFCEREFAGRGIAFRVVQCSTSFNALRGTLRGMHYQEGAAAEDKLVRCTMGAIHDVIVDLRPESPTHLQHFGVELTADNGKMLVVPKGFAHGFLTLTAATEVFYMVGEYHAPQHATGLRHDDPALAIDWPAPVRVISDRDRNWPSYGAR